MGQSFPFLREIPQKEMSSSKHFTLYRLLLHYQQHFSGVLPYMNGVSHSPYLSVFHTLTPAFD